MCVIHLKRSRCVTARWSRPVCMSSRNGSLGCVVVNEACDWNALWSSRWFSSLCSPNRLTANTGPTHCDCMCFSSLAHFLVVFVWDFAASHIKIVLSDDYWSFFYITSPAHMINITGPNLCSFTSICFVWIGYAFFPSLSSTIIKNKNKNVCILIWIFEKLSVLISCSVNTLINLT